jgi:3-phosphoshikimate 1-carboxyvinyltransferase
MNLTISHHISVLCGNILVPESKSESNRILILEALSKGEISVANLSEALDTTILRSALISQDVNIDIGDAGTAMRFLTAYYCATNQHKILTGSERMQERPIGILVNALRDIGFNISYVRNEGFPPLEISPVDLSALKNSLKIAGNVSSQFISALMMIAPVLEKGLEIKFTTNLISQPYLKLTAELMKESGIEVIIKADGISISHQDFHKAQLTATPDWSAASYWFSIAALSNNAQILIEKLSIHSYQGDSHIAQWAKDLNVGLKETEEGLLLYSEQFQTSLRPMHFDFADYPDLAQTVIVLCAAKNIKATFSGLQSLRIKETDRIAALQNELVKFGVKLEEISAGNFQLTGAFIMSHQHIKTYNDHRMAMAFAPLALLGRISIEDAEVVQKSYPNFWDEMKKLGFDLSTSL